MKHYFPSFDEFLKLSEQGNTIPVYRQLLADTLTPVMAYQRLAQPIGFARSAHAFLLESAEVGERARYSFVAADPEATFEARGRNMVIRRGGREDQVIEGRDPLSEMRKMLVDYRPVHLRGLPRFTGGLVGYAGYDMVRYYEDLGDGPVDDRNLPDLSFGLYRTIVIFDHYYKTIKVVANAHIQGDPGQAYTLAQEAIERTINRLQEGHPQPVGEIALGHLPQKPFESNFSRPNFEKAVEACKEYIRAGDIFQVVLSQRLAVTTKASPFEVTM